jgi:hypothetical protein
MVLSSAIWLTKMPKSENLVLQSTSSSTQAKSNAKLRLIYAEYARLYYCTVFLIAKQCLAIHQSLIGKKYGD